MKSIFISLRLLLVMTVLTGIVYPIAVTLIGQAIFPRESSGSLIEQNGKVIGSSLIGQKFAQDKYFWSRPSANDYNPLPSGGSNLAPTSKKLSDSVRELSAKYTGGVTVPPDMLFSSASGLDPHISPESAIFQIDRILKARGWDETRRDSIAALVRKYTAPRQMGFLGEKRVNVLALNMALDGLG
ncbi:MAG: potassium-transporting ATPase subunit KdpC [Bdellovibrionales bacterium]|nr:potassium-transporting ATPase subunit KdpC [Bdellovibrionales bacterium]